MTDHEVMVLIRTKRESCAFTAGELIKWLMEYDEEAQYTAVYRRVQRLLERLPVEALSKKFYRLLVIPDQVMEKSTKKTEKKEKTDFSSIAKQVLDYLNEKTGKRYKGKPADLLKIKARLAPPENHTLEDFKKVIDIKCAEWKGTSFEKFLRPETLFSTKFESYLNQQGPLKQQGKIEEMGSYDFTKYIKGD
jgi:uncharacterized phage protein (TIGR02220 family)